MEHPIYQCKGMKVGDIVLRREKWAYAEFT